MQLFLDKFFWFSQPSTILTPEDKYLGYVFAGLLVLAILFRLSVIFSRNPVNKVLLKKFWHLTFSTGLSGLIWLGVRYENTPIFSQRYWAGLALAIGVVWLLFVLKYLVFDYFKQKSEYNREQIKNKYLPKAR